MEIISIRKWYTDKTTISELQLDPSQNFDCYILEPTTRVGADPRGILAIPEGRYEITMYDSPRFGMRVPLLNNIPGHNYVEIHPGNTQIDTHDCLLPGMRKDIDTVFNSRSAFGLIVPQIDHALNTQSVYITIKNGAAS